MFKQLVGGICRWLMGGVFRWLIGGALTCLVGGVFRWLWVVYLFRRLMGGTFRRLGGYVLGRQGSPDRRSGGHGVPSGRTPSRRAGGRRGSPGTAAAGPAARHTSGTEPHLSTGRHPCPTAAHTQPTTHQTYLWPAGYCLSVSGLGEQNPLKVIEIRNKGFLHHRNKNLSTHAYEGPMRCESQNCRCQRRRLGIPANTHGWWA